MGNRLEFYQEHLNRVSRSFAFCIERLQNPLRAQVSLSYLICRILDSVEDAEWPDQQQQIRQFQDFDRFLDQGFADGEIEEWVSRFPPGLPEGERLLLPETSGILQDLRLQPPEAQQAILEPVLSMSRGMRYFANRRAGGQLRLHSLTEVNQYCFFVAGVVGEILTRLVNLTRSQPSNGEPVADESLLTNAFHFGLFLQKINLLKDQLQDEKQGRFLVPSRSEVLASLREHAQRAIDYITAQPERSLAYRLFCSWSLFLGLASLPFIQLSWQNGELIKIPRTATQKLLQEVESVVGDNERLRQMFEMLYAVSGAEENPFWQHAPARREVPVMGHEFPSLYQGLLTSAQLRSFGLA